MLVTQNN